MSIMQKVALLGSLAASAYAHGRIISIDVDGTEYEGFTSAMAYSGASDIIAWSAENGDNGFVGPESYSSSDIACHKSGKPGSKAAKVAAGGKVKLQWDTWPESHHGPVLDYMARCDGDDCSKASPGDLSFFKIDEAGLNDAASQNWASDDLIADGNSWTVTVPESLAPGQYVLRHEIIALHSAQDTNGAQNYPQCINLEVTGSGTAEPEGEPATEFYTASDPGISLSIYNNLESYEIPGPAVWDGASTGGSSSGSGSTGASSSAAPSFPAGNSTSAASGPTSVAAAATTSEAYPEPTGEPTFAGSSPAETSPCTTTITLTGSSAPTATSAPVETSDDSEETSDDSSDDSSSNNTPTTTSAPAADVSAIASSLPSSVLNKPIPSDTASASETSDDGKPSKPLPEGFTLKDLLEWVNYLLSKAFNETGKHARDVTRR